MRITDKLNTPAPRRPRRGDGVRRLAGRDRALRRHREPTEGASCNLVTTFDALMPGAVTESKRSIWALGAVQLDDGGADNDADTPGDNTLFMTQGLFVP